MEKKEIAVIIDGKKYEYLKSSTTEQQRRAKIVH